MAFDPVVAEILREQGSLSARLDALERYVMKEDEEEDTKEGEKDDMGSDTEMWIPAGGSSSGGGSVTYDGFPL